MDEFLQLRPDVFESVCVFFVFWLVHEFLDMKIFTQPSGADETKVRIPHVFLKAT